MLSVREVIPAKVLGGALAFDPAVHTGVLRAGETAYQVGHRGPPFPCWTSEGWGRITSTHQRLAD